MRTRSAFLGLLFIGILASVAPAETTLRVELGWQGIFRARHWGPVFVTLADTRPRNAIIEVYSGHDELHAMHVRQMVPLNVNPVTYAIYIPLQNWGPEMLVTIRDANTGRRLTGWNLQESGSDTHFEPVQDLIGITGRPGAEQLIGLQFQVTNIKTPWVNPSHLPGSARGYDAFNVLFLNQPDLARFPTEQQEAMLEWVRSGGRIVCWMGEDALPGSGPLLSSFPATIAENIAVELRDNTLANAGLASRFRTLKGRSLLGNPGAHEIPLFSRSTSAWRRQIGLGSITLLPVDVSTLIFDTPTHSRAFWEPILGNAVDFTKDPSQPPQTDPAMAYQINSFNEVNSRRAEAANQAMNLLGDVPGAGDFGFSYVIFVLLGMMLFVGPVDWIILKKLGRQPWTWVTTSGWIALITLGAVYVGYFFRSGELHYRTLRLIDQSDNLSIATLDVAGIYSPQTAVYTLKAPTAGWWQPLSGGMGYYSNRRLLTDISFHQSYQGNHPDPMLIRVWNMRFLTSDSIATGLPYLRANLQHNKQAGRDHLSGTITNVSNVTLKGLCYRFTTRRGIVGTQTLAPGETITIDLPLARDRQPNAEERKNTHGYNRPAYVGPEIFFDLAIDRSLAIDRLLVDGSQSVCIYAEIDNPTPQVTLDPVATNEKHQQFVRAILPLEAASP